MLPHVRVASLPFNLIGCFICPHLVFSEVVRCPVLQSYNESDRSQSQNEQVNYQMLLKRERADVVNRKFADAMNLPELPSYIQVRRDINRYKMYNTAVNGILNRMIFDFLLAKRSTNCFGSG